MEIWTQQERRIQLILLVKTGEDSSLNMFNKVTGFEDMNIDNM